MPAAAAAIPALSSIASIAGPVGSILGAVQSAQSLFGGSKPKAAPAPVAAVAKPYEPNKPSALARPQSLGSFADYSPAQERSALATKGVQSGLGKDEDAYYKNLIQRSLIGDNNTVSGDTSSLLPVESQYFSKQGVNTSDVMKFLEQLQGAS
jgi:hypothetical protein